MQGRDDVQRGYLDVEALAGELLVPGSVFAFLAGHRGRLFPDSMMEDLFPSGRGRPSVPAPVIGSVLVLQALLGLSDRETAEALTFDLRWKTSWGYGLDETAFHPNALSYWHKRLAARSDPHRFMDVIAAVRRFGRDVPGGTSSPRTAPTARTRGGGFHARSPRTG